MTTVDPETPSGGAPAAVTDPPLPLATRISYGGGDFASQLVWSLTGSYLLVFYTDTVGLAAGAISLLMLFARVLDAVIDPVIGAAAERTRSRHGRFRPWIIYGTPFLAVFFVLTFTAPSFGGSGGARIAWATFTYVVLGILYSAVNLPYGALAAVMTRSTPERISLNGFRMVGTNLGAVLLSATSMPLILALSGVGDGETTTVRGYTLTAALMAVVAVPLFYWLAHRCREVVVPAVTDRVPLRTTVRVVLGNRPLMVLFVAMLMMMTGVFGRIGVALYYYMYCMQRYDLISVLMAAPSVTGALGILLFAPLARRFGKRRMTVVSLLSSAVVLVAISFVDYTDVTLIVALTVLLGFTQFCSPIVMSMVPDCIDVAEDRTGVRADGTSYAAISLSTKLASAFGGSVGVLLLAAAGYVAGAEQTTEVLDGINTVVNVLPAACMVLGAVAMAFYRISDDDYQAARARLDARHEAAGG